MSKIPGLIFLALLLIVFVPALPVYAQQTGQVDSEPEEYGEEEFSPVLLDLRRAEIVMLGSFPITFFLTLEAFDVYRFIDHRGDEDSYRYGFWPYRSADPAPYSSGEIGAIVATALSASLLIAVADYIIGRAKQKRPER